MDSNHEFITSINDLRTQVLSLDDLSLPPSAEECGEVLEVVKKIATDVCSEIQRAFPTQQMDQASLDSVLALERVLLRVRAENTLRIQALKDFEVMSGDPKCPTN